MPRRVTIDFTTYTLAAVPEAEETSDAADVAAAVADPLPNSGRLLWSGTIGMEGVLTGDGRFIERNALRWDETPLPFRWAREDLGAHQGAQVTGRILTLERGEGGRILATGDIHLDSAIGYEAAQEVISGRTVGVSMDLDDVTFEVRVAGDVYDEVMAAFDEEPEEGEVLAEEPERDEEGRVTVARMSADDEVMVTTSARIRAATMCSIPAFAEAVIEPGEITQESGSEALVASAVADVSIPASHFATPRLTEPTPIVITEDGRIYGHLAVWGTCHTAYADQCVTPPTSASDYAYFHTGSIVVDDGRSLPVGTITMDTLHAGQTLSAARTVAHYENTGAIAAFVQAGEDEHGIYVTGTLAPGLSDEQVRALRASPLSGDWRRMKGSLELVAALAVNVPGFPIPRPSGYMDRGEQTTLVASGMLAPAKVIAPGLPGSFTAEDLRYLKGLVHRARRDEAAALAARVAKTKADAMARKLGLI